MTYQKSIKYAFKAKKVENTPIKPKSEMFKEKPKKVEIDPISKWQPITSKLEKFVLFDKKWRNY